MNQLAPAMLKPLLTIATFLLTLFAYAQTPDAAGILYVNKNVTGGNGSGNSWANAVHELADGLEAARTNTSIKEIWVAKGIYLPQYAPVATDNNGNPVTMRDRTFLLVSNVKVYGGFDPDNGMADRATRDPRQVLTVLSGDLGVSGVITDNAYHVVISAGNAGTAELNGFTVTGGHAKETGVEATYTLNVNSIAIPRIGGGGIYLAGGSPVIAQVNISNNTAMTQGGGMYLKDCFSAITNVHISGNTAETDGGGMFNANASPVLTNVLINNNSASVRGGGIVNAISNSVLTNVTITNNMGGGMLNHSGSLPQVRNSIIYGNTSFNSLNNSPGGDNPVISYSLVQGSGGSNSWSSNTGIDAGYNIDVNPLFIDAANRNYRLQVGSPAINAGNNALFYPGSTPDLSAITIDIDGNPRSLGGLTDQGAYETPGNITPDANGIVYVKTVATGSGTGDSWANATSSLQGAIDAAASQVFVAKGTYYAEPASFRMRNGIAVYGGFDPDSSITELTHNRLIPGLSGDPFRGSVLNGGHQRTVIYNIFSAANPLDATAILNGFTITAGNSTDGGGIYNEYASPTLTNLLLTGNMASVRGGGIFNWNASPVLRHIVVSGNAASGQGGGIYSGRADDLKMTNVYVKGNTAQEGGGIYNFDAQATLTNVAVTGNTATGNATGSAIHTYAGANYLINVSIADNTGNAFYNGAVAFLDNAILYGGTNGLGYTARHSLIEGTGTPDLNLTATSIPAAAIFSNLQGGDYTLLSSSAAVNAGSNSLYPDWIGSLQDLAGNPRLFGAHIDLGAYELQQPPTTAISPDHDRVLYVDKNVSGGNGSGDSWTNAIQDLADALLWADNNKSSWSTAAPLTIHVAQGTYLPKYRAVAADDNNVETTDRDKTFLLVKDVKIYGGFDPAHGLNDLATRDPQLALTILSGDTGTPGVNTDNAYHVVVAAGAVGTALLDGFTVTGASANGNGSITINMKTVARNQGGGIYCIDAGPLIARVKIRDNNAGLNGGGMYNDNAPAILTNVVVNNNQAGSSGGAMYNNASSPLLTNVTICNNMLVSNGGSGGLYNTSASSPQIRNSIILGNTVPNISNNSVNDIPGISYSIVQGLNSSANINIIFNDAANSDYSLKAGSPAIDRGSNALFTGLDAGTKDIAGNPRVHDYTTGGIIDMGAYESPYTAVQPDINGIIYVRIAARGNGSGNSWDNATADLQEAINTGGVQQVWVAAGTYPVPPAQYFVMKNGVAVYGGFDPDNNIDDLADTRIIPCVNDASFSGGSVLKGNVQRPVIYNDFTPGSAMDNTAILDGFTITEGKGLPYYGGGIYNMYASPVLRNLLITNNTATYDGGAIYNFSSSPVLANVVLSGNTAEVGGAMANHENSNPVLTNVVIKDNTASWFGGAVYNFFSSPELTNTIFTGNTAPSGSVMYNEVAAFPVLTNVTISNNTAYDDNLLVNSYGSSPQIRNSIIYGNTGSLILNFSPAEDIPVFSYSLVEGSGGSDAWVSATGSDGGHNIDRNPLFTDAAAGDYSLATASLAINAGNGSYYTGLDVTTKDLAGNPRLAGTSIDMGAFEFQDGTPLPLQLLSFTVSRQGNAALLSWTTANEQHGNGFEIERSADAVSWKCLAFQPSLAGNSNGNKTLHYEHTDLVPLYGRNFYRLRQTGFNGSVMYSQVRFISFESRQQVQIYPNPARENIYIEGLNGNELIVVYDAIGKIVLQVSNKAGLAEVSLKNIIDGDYYIHIISEDGSKIIPHKIIKLK